MRVHEQSAGQPVLRKLSLVGSWLILSILVALTRLKFIRYDDGKFRFLLQLVELRLAQQQHQSFVLKSLLLEQPNHVHFSAKQGACFGLRQTLASFLGQSLELAERGDP